MAQETQKPTENKDFDFILNQNPEGQPLKKGPDKKIIAIFILVVATLLVMGVSFIVGSNKNVKNETKNTIEKLDNNNDSLMNDKLTVAQKYMTAMKKGNVDEARSMLVDNNDKNLSAEVDDFWGNVNVDSCIELDEKTDAEDIRFSCAFINNRVVFLNFSFQNKDSILLISDYYTWVDKATNV